MTKEELLNKVAERLMTEWNLNKFKASHKRLFSVIMESMDEYAGIEVKKLDLARVDSRRELLPNTTLEESIQKAKPNMDKIKNVDAHCDSIR